MKPVTLMRWAAGAAISACLLVPAHAAVVTHTTLPGATHSGRLLHVTTTVPTLADTLTMVVESTGANPTGAIQGLNDLDVIGSGGTVVGPEHGRTSVSGASRHVRGAAPRNHSPFTDGGSAPTESGLMRSLTLPFRQSSRTIIGPPNGSFYSNARHGVAGSNEYDRLLFGPAAIDRAIQEFTGESMITGVRFSATEVDDQDCQSDRCRSVSLVPVGLVVGLVGSVLAFAVVRSRRRHLAVGGA